MSKHSFIAGNSIRSLIWHLDLRDPKIEKFAAVGRVGFIINGRSIDLVKIEGDYVIVHLRDDMDTIEVGDKIGACVHTFDYIEFEVIDIRPGIEKNIVSVTKVRELGDPNSERLLKK